MKPDSYYRFRKVPERKTLMILESFAREYEPLHVAKKRTNQVYCYLTEKPSHIVAERARNICTQGTEKCYRTMVLDYGRL